MIILKTICFVISLIVFVPSVMMLWDEYKRKNWDDVRELRWIMIVGGVMMLFSILWII